MKQGWEIKIFEDCIVKVRSTTKIPKKKFLNDGAYPIISQEDEFINGYWDNEDDIFTVEKPLVIFGDHTKKVKYVDFNFVMGADGIKVLQPIDDINARFFFYQIQSLTIEDLGYARHFRLLKKQYLFIPLLEEQKRIVAKLDKCFEAIDKARTNVQKNLNNAKELFQSQLNQIFSQKGDGWEEKKLIDVNKFIDYRGRTPEKVSKGIRLITAKNVKMGYLKREPEEFINPDDYESWMTRGIPRKNDVLFTTEAPLANVALLDTDEKIALAQRIITFSPVRETLTGEYLHYCLQSKESQEKILAQATGATVSGIKSKLLKEITIYIPSLDIQENIKEKLDVLKSQTQTLESNYQQELDALDELKKSILQKAFNGEL